MPTFPMRFLSAPFQSAINHRTLSSSAIHVFTTIGCTEATSTTPDVYRAKAFMFLEALLLCRWNYHEAQSCVWKSMTSASSIEPRQEVAVLRRPVANVISASLLDDLAFTLGHAFLHQEKSGPGWIHHFHAVGIWTTEVFVHSPTEGTIPQANQTGFTQDIEHVPPQRTAHFDINHARHRAVMRLRNVHAGIIEIKTQTGDCEPGQPGSQEHSERNGSPKRMIPQNFLAEGLKGALGASTGRLRKGVAESKGSSLRRQHSG